MVSERSPLDRRSTLSSFITPPWAKKPQGRSAVPGYAGKAPLEGQGMVSTVSKASAAAGASVVRASSQAVRNQRLAMRLFLLLVDRAAKSMPSFRDLSAVPELQTDCRDAATAGATRVE